MPSQKIQTRIPTVTRRVHPALGVAAALLGFAATLAAVLIARNQ
ncbi:MAG: hypothetical protein ABW202_08480 [Duganella sp.]